MSVIDKATALKHSVSGSNINKIVCKASSRDLAGPKKKHIDFLINLTNSPSVSMPQLADMIGERLQNNNWIVAMKALITAHNLLTLGNEVNLIIMSTSIHWLL
jgi:UDP-N-acetylenolpyruvoylglucosamine reductase